MVNNFSLETRRSVIRKALLVAGGLFVGAGGTTGCEPSTDVSKSGAKEGAEVKKDVNTGFIRHVREVMGIGRDFGIDGYVQLSRQKTYTDKGWMVNSEIGNFKTSVGTTKLSLDDNGEPKVDRDLDKTRKVEYPKPNPICKEVLSFGDNHIVIYGTKYGVERMKVVFVSESSVVKIFLDQYFAQFKDVDQRVIHLVFSDSMADKDLEDIGNYGPKPKFESGEIGKAMPLKNHDKSSDKYGKMERIDIVLNIQAIDQDYVEGLGFDYKIALRMLLVNELTNMLAMDKNNLETSETTESWSTLAHFLSGFDEDFTKLVMGGDNYQRFIEMIAEEMQKIRKVN